MVDKEISSLTAKTTLDDADILALVDDGTSTTKKITWANLYAQITDDIAMTPLSATCYVVASDADAYTLAYATKLQTAGANVWVCDGTADDVQIAAAIAALPASGGIVRLSEGTFDLTSTITMDAYTYIKGSGIYSTIIDTSGTGGFSITGENCEISDMQFIGNASVYCVVARASNCKIHDLYADSIGTTGSAVFGGYATSETIDNLEFIDCIVIDCGRNGFILDGTGSPIAFTNVRIINCQAINCGKDSRYNDSVAGFILAENNNLADALIQSCYAEENWESGFHIEPSLTITRVNIADCTSINNGIDNGSTAFGAGFFIGCGDVNIDNCRVEGNDKNGIIYSNTADNIKVSNCITKNNGSAGINIATAITNSLFCDNVIIGNQRGVTIASAAGSEMNSIIGNYIAENDQYGIYIQAGADSTKVSGNYLYGNSQSASSYNAIQCNGADYCQISDNIIRIAGGTYDCPYGIGIAAGSNYHMVHGNDLYSSGLTGDISDAGTGTLKRDNRNNAGTGWIADV